MPDLKTVLLEIVVICAAARGLGWLFQKLGQPRVVGEILAGILLGPSLFGWLAPASFASLFPPDGLEPLYFLSQIGLLLFMFQVGLALEASEFRRLGRLVVLTSNVSVLVPLLAGAGLALYLYPRLSSAAVPLPVFALFIGTAMSVTAFPVLARILTERNLLQTKVGVVTIGSAAVDDITAWCLLALLIAKVRAGAGASLGFTLASLAAYLIVMTWVARPLLARYTIWRRDASHQTLAFSLIFMFLSAWVTERIGIHALFGAFFAGVILPRGGNLSASVSSSLERITSVLFLPLFFAFTGLRMSVRLLNGSGLWLDCALIIVIAVVGKLIGCAVVARTGMTWRDALSVGVLMNTRGLIELVILK